MISSMDEEKSKFLKDGQQNDDFDTKSFLHTQTLKRVETRKMKLSLSDSLVGIALFAVCCLLLIAFVNFLASSPSSSRVSITVLSLSEFSVDCDKKKNSDINLPDDDTKLYDDPVCNAVSDLDKFDCFPEPNSNEADCLKRGCCWKALNNVVSNSTSIPLGTPYCYYPSNYQGYTLSSSKTSPTGIVLYLNRATPSGFPDDIDDITVNCTFLNNNQVEIEIYDTSKKRYQVPIPTVHEFKARNAKSPIDARLYEVNFDKERIWITRISSGKEIFSFRLSQLVFANQMIQASITLPSNNIYGIGESKAPFLKNSTWQRYVLFARDRAPVEDYNLYGAHPFYLVMEDNESESTGNSNGVILINSNAMEVVIQPTPAITFRPIGGVIDFIINVGPSPSEVIQQYTNVIGRTFLPPYWSLGFHLCRFGYKSTNDTRDVMNRNRKAGIPIDVQWNDIDYMNSRNDFTLSENFSDLPLFVEQLHQEGMHYMMIIDPAISNVEPPGSYPPYDEGVQMDVFVKNISGQILVGKVWNKATSVFPDFTNPITIRYWSKQLKRFHAILPFDGAWIDMNEPSNFVDGSVDGCPRKSTLENPPFVPGNIEPLNSKTLCMSAKHYYSDHYNVHNLYGLMETIATNIGLSQTRGNRPFIISRSTFPSQGHFGGHWDGDIYSTWDSMRWSISSILNMNMFGISMVGADICGFNGNTTAQLCARWSSLGAFYPFSRNHNSDDCIDQDPVSLGHDVVSSARNALQQRYFLLPYLYTLFFKSHTNGETVARSLMFEFPTDKTTYGIDKQFLWGSGLMIVPVLEPNKTEVEAYLPAGIWYNLQNGTAYGSDKGTFVTFGAEIDEINLLIRGGRILPGQKHEKTTTASRSNDFTLLVALDTNGAANGELYWDDGDSIETYMGGFYNLLNFNVAANTLTTDRKNWGYNLNMTLGTVVVYGVENAPKKVTLNGNNAEYFYNEDVKVLHCVKLRANLEMGNTLIWE